MADDLYDRDYFAWAQAQAEALRAHRSGENALDYDNLAEEVEDLGGSIRRACISQITNIIEHLLKIELLGGPASLHWRSEVISFRIELESDLTPSLAAALPSEIDAIYPKVRRRLGARLEAEGVKLELPQACPYGWDDILGRGVDWTPEPAERSE